MTAPFKDVNPLPLYTRHGQVAGWTWADETGNYDNNRIYYTQQEALRALLEYQHWLNNPLPWHVRLRFLLTRLWRDESTLPRR